MVMELAFGWRCSVFRLLVGMIALSGVLRPIGGWCAANQEPGTNGFDRVVSHYAQRGYFQGTVLIAEHGKVIYARRSFLGNRRGCPHGASRT